MTAFTTEIEPGIAILVFDLPGEPVNKLTAAVKAEFEEALDRAAGATPAIRAVVLISGKPDTLHRRRGHRGVHPRSRPRPRPRR